jgi:hypothetical protein
MTFRVTLHPLLLRLLFVLEEQEHVLSVSELAFAEGVSFPRMSIRSHHQLLA